MKAFRTEKVGREIQYIVSEVIAKKLQDPRVSTWTSVTRVKVSNDLEWAKVYVSVLGDESTQNRTIDALRHASKFIQNQVFRQLAVRRCPNLVFELDESLKKAREINQLIDDSMAELRSPQEPAQADDVQGASG